MKREKIEGLMDIIKDNRIVCDSFFRCEGWQENTTIPQYNQKFSRDKAIQRVIIDVLVESFKFCPWCGKEIKWNITE